MISTNVFVTSVPLFRECVIGNACNLQEWPGAAEVKHGTAAADCSQVG